MNLRKLSEIVRRSNLSTLISLRRLAAPIAICLLASSTLRADDPSRGEKIYKELCANCHGANGEGGTKEYATPLMGDRPVADLKQLIHDTMPEGNPEACQGEDAEAVARYIYDAFYSEIAQARNRPPRIELSRLTVQQYRNAVADLVGSFIGRGHIGEERGLQVSLFSARGFRQDKKFRERVDPQIDFVWTDAPPVTGKLEDGQYSAQWTGGIYAPDTGNYELILKANNGVRLYVNNSRTPLIDAWVRSGNDTEYRENLFLLGGRAYPIRVEFFKAKEDTKSTVSLQWVPPKGTQQVVPNRYLLPNWFPETLVVSTPFPPDDRSIGYERGTTISKAWEQSTTQAAIEVADRIVRQLPQLAKFKPESSEARSQSEAFCYLFAERAWRRPLTEEEKWRTIQRHFAGTDDYELSVKRVVIQTLKSPNFLYLGEQGEGREAFNIAERLAISLWDSLPDDTLRNAAKRGELFQEEAVRQQAWRMLSDHRAKVKVREFFQRWLGIDRFTELSKSKELFPEFSDLTIADLRISLDMFTEDIVWSQRSDFRQLLLSDEMYFNGRLARLYGVDVSDDAAFRKVKLSSQQRAGILSHPLLLTGFAYHSTSSPIHRGVFLFRNALGRTLRPPPIAVAPFEQDLHPNLTTRERVEMQTQPTACQSCHSQINPLGFALEEFDAIGRYRSEERGKSVNATGWFVTQAGDTAQFTGVRELANLLAGSSEVQAAFVKHLFHHIAKQPVRAYGLTKLEALRDRFAAADFNIRSLIVEIAVLSATQPTLSDEGK